MPRTTSDTPTQFRRPSAQQQLETLAGPTKQPLAELTRESVAAAEPLAFQEPLPADLPSAPAPAEPYVEIQTTIEHRGRVFTVVARGYTLDKLCDMLDRAGYAPPTPAEWRKLPDGTPICPKHATPMRLREKQGDSWWSHRVKGPDGNEYWCKGYHGKDSPGYDL